MSALEEYQRATGMPTWGTGVRSVLVRTELADAAIAELEAQVELWRVDRYAEHDRAEQAEAEVARLTWIAHDLARQVNCGSDMPYLDDEDVIAWSLKSYEKQKGGGSQ